MEIHIPLSMVVTSLQLTKKYQAPCNMFYLAAITSRCMWTAMFHAKLPDKYRRISFSTLRTSRAPLRLHTPISATLGQVSGILIPFAFFIKPPLAVEVWRACSAVALHIYSHVQKTNIIIKFEIVGQHCSINATSQHHCSVIVVWN